MLQQTRKKTGQIRLVALMITGMITRVWQLNVGRQKHVGIPVGPYFQCTI